MIIRTIRNLPVSKVQRGDTVFDTWPHGPEGHVQKVGTKDGDAVLTVGGVDYYADKGLRVSVKRWDE